MSDLIEQKVKELQDIINDVLEIARDFGDYEECDPINRYYEWHGALHALRRVFLDVFDIATIFPWFKDFDKDDFMESGDIYTTITGPEGTVVWGATLYVGADQVQMCIGDYATEVFCCSLEDFPGHYNDFILSGTKVREYTSDTINTLNNTINEIKILIQ